MDLFQQQILDRLRMEFGELIGNSSPVCNRDMPMALQISHEYYPFVDKVEIYGLCAIPASEVGGGVSEQF